MTSRSVVATLACLAIPSVLVAQHGGGAPPVSRAAPAEASQFDFLVGQWELVVRPAATGLAQRIHGAPRLQGTWKAWRGFDGWGIQDELRIVDASGNPLSLSHTDRVYDATARHWNTSTLDVFRSRFTAGTGDWQSGQMELTSRGTDGEGQAFVSRVRITGITPTGFRWLQERSTDDGRTWTENLTIEARRVAATAPR